MTDATPISFGRGSNKARFGQLGQASFVNCYCEDVGEAGKNPFAAVAINGWDEWVELEGMVDVAGIEMMLAVDSNTLLAVAGRSLFQIGVDGTHSIVGGIPSDGVVTMAANRAAPNPQVSIVRDGQWWIWSSGTLTPGSDPDLPPPIWNLEIDGYFIYLIRDGRWFLAGPNDSAIDPLDFAEAEASADLNVAGAARGRTLLIFGERSTEYWDPNGDEVFPFGRTTATNFGCYAGGSVARVPAIKGTQFVDTIVLAQTDHNGAYAGVVLLEGYNPVVISNGEVDRAILAEPDRASIRSMGWVEDGRPFYAIFGTSFYKVYDFKSENWHDRKSHNLPRWRGACHVFFNNKTLFGHYAEPRIFESSADFLDEDGDPIRMLIQMPTVHMYPKAFKVPALFLDVVTGVGQVTGETDPQLIVDYSKDGGASWAAVRFCPLGAAAQRHVRVRLNQLGRFDHNGLIIRISCTAAVARALQQVAIQAVPLG